MKLPHPFVQLPLLFDAGRLEAEIAALGEDAWLPHPQGFPGNSMLPLIACEGSAQDESFAGQMAPTPHLQRCPYLRDTIAALGVVAGRTRLMRLSGHAEVTRHADQGYYWADRVRVHVPIVTQPTVRFDCDDTHTHMAAGECWIFDTWRQHRVLNDDTRSRIHLVVDTVGSESFWELVDRGRTHHGEVLTVPWNPRRIEPSSGAPLPIAFERDALPVVMTPWEMADRLRFLLSEAEPGASLGPARALTERFLRHWRWLWAQWGSRPDGWPVYRQAGEAYLAELLRLVGKTALGNELGLVGAVSMVVRRVAVSGQEALPAGGAAAAAPASAPAPRAAPPPPAPMP
ncbi:MAG: aspartyl/asparaginyl beta-hydroxylase domain-containing protein, partial [Arenimonas sp.]|nr:aspartyl/asparaginyl beta-hydroxylase domain-containing protein [Arenimonas sp.]